jgi:hypothetical protein
VSGCFGQGCGGFEGTMWTRKRACGVAVAVLMKDGAPVHEQRGRNHPRGSAAQGRW